MSTTSLSVLIIYLLHCVLWYVTYVHRHVCCLLQHVMVYNHIVIAHVFISAMYLFASLLPFSLSNYYCCIFLIPGGLRNHSS